MKFAFCATTLLWVMILSSSSCLAGSSDEDFTNVREYFTMAEPSLQDFPEISPLTWMQKKAFLLLQQQSDGVSLLSWEDHATAPELPSEAYNRKKHFGTWIVDTTLGGCYNTRARVLMRDSQVPVSFESSNHCVVKSGRWLDPYTGNTLTSTKDLQIDHVVPLKHAYLSGAWNWEPKKRCLYANFLGDNFHLRAVSGHENMSKGDMSPSGYLPPDSSDVCGYLNDWLKIKMTWNLILVPAEALAIQKAMATYHCSMDDMTISASELSNLRSQILASEDRCRLSNDDNGEGPHNDSIR